MKKEALEDHLGAVLERSWVDLGSSWVPPEGQNRAVAHTALVFLKIDVCEKKVVLRGDLGRSWVDLGAQEAPKWEPRRVKKGVKLS